MQISKKEEKLNVSGLNNVKIRIGACYLQDEQLHKVNDEILKQIVGLHDQNEIIKFISSLLPSNHGVITYIEINDGQAKFYEGVNSVEKYEEAKVERIIAEKDMELKIPTDEFDDSAYDNNDYVEMDVDEFNKLLRNGKSPDEILEEELKKKYDRINKQIDEHIENKNSIDAFIKELDKKIAEISMETAISENGDTNYLPRKSKLKMLIDYLNNFNGKCIIYPWDDIIKDDEKKECEISIKLLNKSIEETNNRLKHLYDGNLNKNMSPEELEKIKDRLKDELFYKSAERGNLNNKLNKLNNEQTDDILLRRKFEQKETELGESNNIVGDKATDYFKRKIGNDLSFVYLERYKKDNSNYIYITSIDGHEVEVYALNEDKGNLLYRIEGEDNGKLYNFLQLKKLDKQMDDYGLEHYFNGSEPGGRHV